VAIGCSSYRLATRCLIRIRSESQNMLSGGHSPAVDFSDSFGFVAEQAQLGLTALVPAIRNWGETPLLIERFEGQPTAAITFRERNPALTDNSAIPAFSALDPAPGITHQVSAVALRDSPLHFTGLRIPHLPIRTISIYECPVCHSDLLPHAGAHTRLI
jgi:hypothetical protein